MATWQVGVRLCPKTAGMQVCRIRVWQPKTICFSCSLVCLSTRMICSLVQPYVGVHKCLQGSSAVSQVSCSRMAVRPSMMCDGPIGIRPVCHVDTRHSHAQERDLTRLHMYTSSLRGCQRPSSCILQPSYCRSYAPVATPSQGRHDIPPTHTQSQSWKALQ